MHMVYNFSHGKGLLTDLLLQPPLVLQFDMNSRLNVTYFFNNFYCVLSMI